MRRSLLVALSVCLSVCALAAGCGSDSGSGEANDPIKFLVFGDPEELAAYRTLIDVRPGTPGREWS